MKRVSFFQLFFLPHLAEAEFKSGFKRPTSNDVRLSRLEKGGAMNSEGGALDFKGQVASLAENVLKLR